MAVVTPGLAQVDYSASRVSAAADRLKRSTMQLAGRSVEDLMRVVGNSRSEIQAALLAQQIDANAGLFVEMVRNRRPAAELREVGAELTDLSRRAQNLSSQASLWRQVQIDLDGLTRELGGRGTAPGPPQRPIIGRATWRGRVDDRVELVIRGRTIEVRTMSGVTNPDGVTTFTTPLPDRVVDVDVTKITGRGEVRVLQQPARANDFTAVIEIYDDNPGSQEYRLDIVWR